VLFWKTKPTDVEAPASSLAEREAEARRAWKAAEIVLTDACTAFYRFRLTNPAHVPVKKIGDQIYVQFLPNDPDLIRLSSTENRARFDRDQKQQAWAILYRELHPEETHIAGVKV
jgi:hypothetical protein